MKPVIPLLCIALLVTGCVFVSTNPAATNKINNEDLNQITGVYSAVGIQKNGAKGLNLGPLIFYGHSGDAGFEEIKIELVGTDTLLCTGYAKGVKIEQKSFKVGKDFVINNGVIPLKTKLDDMGMSEPGAMHLGLALDSQEIRILDNGDAVWRQKTAVTGVVLVVPFAIAGVEEHTFKKIKK